MKKDCSTIIAQNGANYDKSLHIFRYLKRICRNAVLNKDQSCQPLLGYDSALNMLYLLGFEHSSYNSTLIHCSNKPSIKLVYNCIQMLRNEIDTLTYYKRELEYKRKNDAQRHLKDMFDTGNDYACDNMNGIRNINKHILSTIYLFKQIRDIAFRMVNSTTRRVSFKQIDLTQAALRARKPQKRNHFHLSFYYEILTLLGYRQANNIATKSGEFLVLSLDIDKNGPKVKGFNDNDNDNVYTDNKVRFSHVSNYKWLAAIRALNKYLSKYKQSKTIQIKLDGLNEDAQLDLRQMEEIDPRNAGWRQPTNKIGVELTLPDAAEEEEKKANNGNNDEDSDSEDEIRIFGDVRKHAKSNDNKERVMIGLNHCEKLKDFSLSEDYVHGDLFQLKYYMSLACHHFIMLYKPSAAYWILKQFYKICLVLATTDSNNNENIQNRIVKYYKNEFCLGFDVCLNCLGFNRIDENDDFVICNKIQTRLFYFQSLDIIQCYLDWFDMKYYDSIKLRINPMTFETFLNKLDNDSIIGFDNNCFNISESMQNYVHNNQYPNENSNDKTSKYSTLYPHVLGVLFCGMHMSSYTHTLSMISVLLFRVTLSPFFFV